jgi:integrase
MSGLDLYTVGRLLGHADTAATERYAHLSDDHTRAAAGRISGIVGDAMTGRREGDRS